MSLRTSWRSFGLAGVLAFGLVSVEPAHAGQRFACEDPSGVCVAGPDGAAWEPNEKSTKKHRKKRSLKTGGTLELNIEGGRGSVFLNGRYVGTAPVEGVKIPRGKNDLQVRDGADVLASGLLVVPKGASMVVTVRHP